ncbi:glycosyltransferase family 2 protein [Winogradskyella psychrotolerans]|uniref:glycosyltransferase family 2 protein n=1 Tax=Winogradskyella psychrotolerans TaxID=1344585 RepID=UPI001C069416|nr:glycosyltransferase family 2 protein [Winogradskyella psychrotolerans]MBU2919814.1 glycosyltransferase family 2 protein [Winogradskyella psychrotolerans]
MTDLYIVIVTYNGMRWLDKCLKSCANYSVVIIDNASTDETVSFIEVNYPEVTLFKLDKNLGFGQANNIGIKYALGKDADHVFLLNQDAYLVDSVLDDLVTFQKRYSAYGILSPVHITGNRQKLDRGFSNYMLKEKTGQFYSDFVLGQPLSEVYEVPFVNAAAWLLSKDCLETVGGFDPLFFHYGEDDNYCQRVLYHGFKIGVLPSIYVVHDREERQSPTSKAFSVTYYKNREIYYKTKLANINVAAEYDILIKQLGKTILKLQLQLKLSKANGFKKELSLLKTIKPLIIESRTNNVVPGPHYLK